MLIIMAAGSTKTWRHIIEAALLAIAPMAASGGMLGKERTMSQAMTTLDHLVGQVRGAGRIDRALVERLIAAPLHVTADTGYFTVLEARNANMGGLGLTAELREPVPGKGATAGALLTLRITNACPSKAEVERRFGPWKLTDVPHGQSLDEQTSWSRDEQWGKLSFGFAERQPDCLASVVFEAKVGAHAG